IGLVALFAVLAAVGAYLGLAAAHRTDLLARVGLPVPGALAPTPAAGPVAPAEVPKLTPPTASAPGPRSTGPCSAAAPPPPAPPPPGPCRARPGHSSGPDRLRSAGSGRARARSLQSAHYAHPPGLESRAKPAAGPAPEHCRRRPSASRRAGDRALRRSGSGR